MWPNLLASSAFFTMFTSTRVSSTIVLFVDPVSGAGFVRYNTADSPHRHAIEQLSDELTVITVPEKVAEAVERTVRRWLPCEQVVFRPTGARKRQNSDDFDLFNEARGISLGPNSGEREADLSGFKRDSGTPDVNNACTPHRGGGGAYGGHGGYGGHGWGPGLGSRRRGPRTAAGGHRAG